MNFSIYKNHTPFYYLFIRKKILDLGKRHAYYIKIRKKQIECCYLVIENRILDIHQFVLNLEIKIK